MQPQTHIRGFSQYLTQGHQQNSAYCRWGCDWDLGDFFHDIMYSSTLTKENGQRLSNPNNNPPQNKPCPFPLLSRGLKGYLLDTFSDFYFSKVPWSCLQDVLVNVDDNMMNQTYVFKPEAKKLHPCFSTSSFFGECHQRPFSVEFGFETHAGNPSCWWLRGYLTIAIDIAQLQSIPLWIAVFEWVSNSWFCLQFHYEAVN